MNRVQSLKEAARTPVAKFHQLRLNYWRKDIDVICCVEGLGDFGFYLPSVRRSFDQRDLVVDCLDCSGKSNVLHCLKMAISNNWNMARLMFFVDSDLDVYIGVKKTRNKALYYTDFYSIESHCIGDGFFKSVWQDLFKLSIVDDRYDDWKAKYGLAFDSVREIVLPLFAQAVAEKKAGGNVDFDEFKIRDVVRIDAKTGLLSRSNKKISLSKVFPDRKSGLSGIRAARRELKRDPPEKWLRGKYALTVSVYFFRQMKGVLGTRAQGGQQRAIVPFTFSDDLAIELLSSMTPTPRTLAAFLSRRLREIRKAGVECKLTAA